MIGGHDVVIGAIGDPSTLDICARIIQHYWPRARFEDAVTGDKFDNYAELPIGRMHELLVYPDAQAEAAWDADSADSPVNSMLYLILGPDSITLVLDDPDTAEMQSVIRSLRSGIGLLNAYKEAA